MYLLNAFSLNMLPADGDATVRVHRITTAAARDTARSTASQDTLESAVGHAETARLFADALGVPVPCQRTTVVLARGTTSLVGQYVGPRLIEGATVLPDGARIDWLLIEVS